MKQDPWVVYNGFLNTAKFSEHIAWLIRTAQKRGVPLKPVANSEIPLLPGDVWKDFPEKVLFWDKDVRLASYLEDAGCLVMNSSHAIAVCDDKSLTHLALARAGLPQPRTMIAPMTYDNIGYTDLSFLREAEELFGFPMVVKECFGSFGFQVYLAHDHEELLTIAAKIGAKPFLLQEFISVNSGRDVRIQVVGGEVVAAMERYSVNGDFRANLTNGGKMKPYEPSAEDCALAVSAAKACGAAFAGVDLLFGPDGMLVCEVNSNAHFKNICDCTGVDVAESIIDCFLQSEEKNK